MKILAIGDVTSPAGAAHLKQNLFRVRKERGIDFCVVNAENASLITGASPEICETLLAAGADCLTGGNHTLRNRAVLPYLDTGRPVLRPANFPAEVPGCGYAVLDACGYRALVISAMGNAMIEPVLDAPFAVIERILEREEGKYDFALLDIHAEASGEKAAVAFAFDGRIAAVFGTHTHVPTADARILPHGTGFITDVGMCGESGGILGMDAETVVRRMRTHMQEKFLPAAGPCVADGVIFTVDPARGICEAVETLRF